VFGFSFGELVVLVVVAIVVIGPKDLPKVLRTLGQWSGKLRRMASELRHQSGIDDVLRTEGLTEDLNEIRKLARGELDTIGRAATVSAVDNGPALSSYEGGMISVDRDREQPREGPDTGNALPDTAFVYVESFPRSKWADDPVWVLGDPDGVIPKPEPKPEPETKAEPSATAASPFGPPEPEPRPKPQAERAEPSPPDEAPKPTEPPSEERATPPAETA
jgi:sec-independent protein translocase protein TatB